MQALANFWGMINGANTNAVIAVFTIVIAGTTVVYTLVTWRLLIQSRWAFLVDTVIRIMGPTEEQMHRYVNEAIDKMSQRAREVSDRLRKAEVGKDIKKQWQDIEMRWDEARLKMETESYLTSMCRAIETMNKKLARDLYKSLGSYGKEMIEVRNDVINKTDSLKEEVKRLVEEIEKQAKSEAT